MLLLISNSGHYIWYIYLNFAVTQTDDCELGINFADVLKMERYPLFSFFLFLDQKLTIFEQSYSLRGQFSLTSCHFLTAKYSNYLLSYWGFFWHIFCKNILHNICPDIIITSFLTQRLFNSGYDNWLPSRKYMMSYAFSNEILLANVNWLIKLNWNSRMRSTFVWIHLQSYHCPIY